MTGWILKTDGTVEEVSSDLHKQDGSLKALYAALGCELVQCVRAPWGEFWCDEEGLLKPGAVVNEKATQCYWETFPHVTGQPLVGTVFLRIRKGYTLDDVRGAGWSDHT